MPAIASPTLSRSRSGSGARVEDRQVAEVGAQRGSFSTAHMIASESDIRLTGVLLVGRQRATGVRAGTRSSLSMTRVGPGMGTPPPRRQAPDQPAKTPGPSTRPAYPEFPREEPGQRMRFWAHVIGWSLQSAWVFFESLPKVGTDPGGCMARHRAGVSGLFVGRAAGENVP